MNRLPSFLAALAVAVACVALSPPREAAAQAAAVAVPAKCVACRANAAGTGWTCAPASQGGTSCTIPADAQSCTINNPCSETAEPVPIDGAANFTTALLLKDPGAENAFALVAGTGEGRQQYRARCNGVVLARAYSVAMIDQLRSQTSVITL